MGRFPAFGMIQHVKSNEADFVF